MRTLSFQPCTTEWDVLSCLDASTTGRVEVTGSPHLTTAVSDTVLRVVEKGFASMVSVSGDCYVLDRSPQFRALHEALPMVQLLLPMGGLGTRFQAVGITTPKPLIEVNGVPMFRLAVSSFEGIDGIPLRVVFVVRTDHNMDDGIVASFPGAVIVPLHHDTRGAVETCMCAASVLYMTRPMIVLDCDLKTKSVGYEAVLRSMVDNTSGGGPGGVLLTFQSKSPRYSYAALAPDGFTVLKTAEKDPSISDRAIIGAYGFRSGDVFTRAATILMKTQNVADIKEYYLSLLFNILIQELKLDVVVTTAEVYGSFGTPEEMALYLAGGASHMTE